MTATATYPSNIAADLASGGLNGATDDNISPTYWNRLISAVMFGAGSNGRNGYAGPRVNRLPNGGLDIWQRGAGSFGTTNTFTADRFYMVKAGTDTLTVDREGTTKSANSLYSAKCVFTLGSGAGATQVYWPLPINANEPNHDLLGQVVSFAVDVSLLAGVASAVRPFVTTDGIGGTTTYGSYHSNATTRETLSVENVTVPTDATYVRAGLAFAASCTAYVDNGRLNVSPVYCEYVGLTPAEELARCQRYYEVPIDHDNLSQWQAAYRYLSGAGLYYMENVYFAVNKAVAPTMAISGTWLMSTFSGVGTNNPNKRGFAIQATGGTGGNGYFQTQAGCKITAEANP